MRLLAIDALRERGLPAELLPALPTRDEPAMREALAGVEAAFRTAVEASVRQRLAGAPPTLPTGDAREAAMREAMGIGTGA